MIFHIKLYLISLGVFLAIDALWLGIIARRFYATHLGYIMTPRPVWWAALLFYLLFVLGAHVFVILPGLAHEHVGYTLLRGALFGLVTYATYDLTNLALVKDWPLIVTLVDLPWGMTLSTLVCAAGFYAGKWLQSA